ncbi:MAG: T9SS type A sorting domain-containing protein [Candidatus Delongbacteria bacterium]|nr:T9SS type A sorting domain-containing protein [Candidatus Delongbacteria bacterium]MBN2747570.1 T9SS type A sorting domain-containing protein [Bacteroidales bacterium]
MKNILWTIFLTTLIGNISAQEFAPIGAEWYYNEKFASSGDIDFIKFTSEKDTIINGENCRKITKRHKIYCYERPDTEFILNRNDTVFFFDPLFNDFQNLYVFSANNNDSWKIKVEGENQSIDTITISVDSTKTKLINGIELKHLYITYNSIYGNYPSEIIEKIGDIRFMFNWEPWKAMACDFNYTNGLRCYQDSEIGLFSTGIADSCDYTYLWTNIDNLEAETYISIYPNPKENTIQIESNLTDNIEIEVYNLRGCKLSESQFKTTTYLDLKDFKSGFYILNFRYKGEVIATKKILNK